MILSPFMFTYTHTLSLKLTRTHTHTPSHTHKWTHALHHFTPDTHTLSPHPSPHTLTSHPPLPSHSPLTPTTTLTTTAIFQCWREYVAMTIKQRTTAMEEIKTFTGRRKKGILGGSRSTPRLDDTPTPRYV